MLLARGSVWAEVKSREEISERTPQRLFGRWFPQQGGLRPIAKRALSSTPATKRPSSASVRYDARSSRRDDQGCLLNACASRDPSPEFAQTSSHFVAAARAAREHR